MRPGLAIGLVLLAGCADHTDDPYTVTLDLAPSIRALGDDDLFEAGAARDLLAGLGDAAVPALTAALDREDAPIRAAVVDVLAARDAPAGFESILRAAADPDPAVRAAAAHAMAGRDDPRAVALVEASLNDPSTEVRTSAAGSCARSCRSPAALTRLIDLALDPATPLTAEVARRAIAERAPGDAVRATTVRRAAAVLEDASSIDERLRAALLLADAGDSRAVPALADAATSDDVVLPVRVHAVAALGAIPDGSAVTALAVLVGSEPSVLSHAACGALEGLAKLDAVGAASAHARCPDRR
jgi:HEAT repeat protein